MAARIEESALETFASRQHGSRRIGASASAELILTNPELSKLSGIVVARTFSHREKVARRAG